MPVLNTSDGTHSGTHDERNERSYPLEGWTLTTLYVHLSRVISDQARRLDDQTSSTTAAIQAALISSEKAIAKAEIANEKRFDSVNEFRAVLTDQTAKFMPRAELESQFKSIEEKIGANTVRIERSEGKGQGLNLGWSLLVSVVGFIAGGIGIFLAFHK